MTPHNHTCKFVQLHQSSAFAWERFPWCCQTVLAMVHRFFSAWNIETCFESKSRAKQSQILSMQYTKQAPSSRDTTESKGWTLTTDCVFFYSWCDFVSNSIKRKISYQKLFIGIQRQIDYVLTFMSWEALDACFNFNEYWVPYLIRQGFLISS